MKRFGLIIIPVFAQSFLLMLPVQATHKEINGCGDDSGLGRFVPNQPVGVDFRPVCDNHDECYGTLGESREHCDNVFRSALRAKCEKTLLRSASGIFGTVVTGGQALTSCYGVAEAYYRSVRERGGKAYSKAQSHAREELASSQTLGKEWREYPGTGLAKSLAISQDGTPVIIGTDNKIYRGSGNGWVELSGTGLAMGIAIDGRGKTWIIGTDQRIYFHNRGSTWQEYPGTGLAKSLTVSQDGTPIIIGTDDKIYTGSGSGWVELSGTGLAVDVAVDGTRKTWIIGTDQRIYFHL